MASQSRQYLAEQSGQYKKACVWQLSQFEKPELLGDIDTSGGMTKMG